MHAVERFDTIEALTDGDRKLGTAAGRLGSSARGI
jgi:hypothetical protein